MASRSIFRWIAVACGESHFVCLDHARASIWVMGTERSFQLGLKMIGDRHRPVKSSSVQNEEKKHRLFPPLNIPSSKACSLISKGCYRYCIVKDSTVFGIGRTVTES